MNGPAIIERATGKVEAGNYVKDLQHGEWKSTLINGTEEKEFYSKGKLLTKEDMAKLLAGTAASKKTASQASQLNKSIQSKGPQSPGALKASNLSKLTI